MGSRCSQIRCSCTACNCFIYDKNIKNIEVERSVKTKWIWTKEHESTFVTILSEPEYNYNAPTVIIDLIVTLTYSKDEPFYVRKAQFHQEIYYSKPAKLLNKKLCQTWYHSNFLNQTSFPVVIFSSDPNTSDHIIHSFYEHDTNESNVIMPGLQMYHSSNNCCIKRGKLCINHCQIEIDLMQIDDINNDSNYYLYFNHPTYFILINQNDSIQRINKICDSIWNKYDSMNNCILVTNITNGTINKFNNISLLSSKWNVPYIQIDYNDSKSVDKLFKFAIHHYWFSQVTKWNTILIS